MKSWKPGIVAVALILSVGLGAAKAEETTLKNFFQPGSLFPQYDSGPAPDKQRNNLVRANVITIDTRDRETCLRTVDELGIETPVCENPDPAKPYISIFGLKDISHEEAFDEDGHPYTYHELALPKAKLNESEKRFLQENKGILLLGLATFGALVAAPPSFSKWDSENKMEFLASMPKKWAKNVRAGPIMDKDDFMINYIGHPISGAIYYQIARHEGYSWMKSFGYSVLMSTFFWEYGVEAFAETPSLQDLIATPVVGSLLGELFYQAIKKIDKNDGKLLRSKTLGSVTKVILNPGGYAVRGLGKMIDSFEKKAKIQSYTSFVAYPIPDHDHNLKNYYVGMQLNFFWE
ncbi:MAG: hypothetical protein A2070_00890 [Bdellovibrionales bacterium GWC1_52_8]|nr:MAG: hypothetical protein A2070_00890 [Bdellovibrionales bacterium GWC1_52_8]